MVFPSFKEQNEKNCISYWYFPLYLLLFSLKSWFSGARGRVLRACRLGQHARRGITPGRQQMGK
jgi:hypothetical protein